jgi:flagellar motor switch protein FliN/FliY
MEIGTLINSELMQIYPLEFAEEVIDIMMPKTESNQTDSTTAAGSAQQAPPMPTQQAGAYAPTSSRQYHPENVNVQPVQFQGFDGGDGIQKKENIEIIMDVPLEVSVELGRTNKKIREILEFSPGSVIELDKQAGEPIDILVNGKFVAKGEVVVIDENFGIRITDIISPDKRI